MQAQKDKEEKWAFGSNKDYSKHRLSVEVAHDADLPKSSWNVLPRGK